ncbi:uncharacterized protein LOC107824908 isoform X2 [Nicotiana tabacum]|uniref:Uncharacterized protein LOC107824908 isoform X2 n=5 Tax=Nicotiana tabacum TaxID=4097 RepID=A0AC58UUJ9_TOBAC
MIHETAADVVQKGKSMLHPTPIFEKGSTSRTANESCTPTSRTTTTKVSPSAREKSTYYYGFWVNDGQSKIFAYGKNYLQYYASLLFPFPTLFLS